MSESQKEKPDFNSGSFETTAEKEMIAQQNMTSEITRHAEHWEVTRQAVVSAKKNNAGFTVINNLSGDHHAAQHRLTGAVMKKWKGAQP